MLWRGYVSSNVKAKLSEALGLSEDETGAVLEFWASLHDLGKIVPAFQRQVEIPDGFADDGKSVAHQRASAWCVPGLLESQGYAGGKTGWARLAAQILGGHHGRFEELKPRLQLGEQHLPFHGLGAAQWQEERARVVTALRDALAPGVPVSRGDRTAAVLMTGLVILADWLASQVGYITERLSFVPERGDPAGLEAFHAGSVEVIDQWVKWAGLSRLRLKPGGFKDDFPDFEPNELQGDLAEKLPGLVTGPGLLLLAAPMGMGKTEAALHAARLMGTATGSSGVFVALPTMATSDQMFTRVAEYVARRGAGESSAALAHGMAWLRPVDEMLAEVVTAAAEVAGAEDTVVHSTEWLRGAKRPMLAGVGVGTIDQLLLSVLHVRHNSLRMFAVTNKVVVIDEVHAFDAYMRGLLSTLLKWLGECRVPVVLMSATLPSHVARELSAAYLGTDGGLEVPYPGWVYAERSGASLVSAVTVEAEQKRTLGMDLVEVGTGDGGAVKRLPVLERELRPLAEHGGCGLVICTTVPEAQQTYDDLKEWARQHCVELKLLHARFPVGQREAETQRVIDIFGKPVTEEACARRATRRCVLIATSIVEQSLDIDADLVVSDLAPIELLLQRAGRLQRHRVCDELRPQWALPGEDGRRRMVVLSGPEQDPRWLLARKAWLAIYPAANLVRAHRLLVARQTDGVRIPDDVQNLVDLGNPGVFPALDDELLEGFTDEELTRAAEALVQRQGAEVASVPDPPMQDLVEFSEHEVDETQARTRFNADSERLLPLFELPDGTVRVGSPTGDPLPELWQGRLALDEAKAVMSHVVPVHGSLVRGHGPQDRLPEPWASAWPLDELIALCHRVDAHGVVHEGVIGGRSLLLDQELGIVERR